MVSRDEILAVLCTIPDPEMPISIVDLGLVEEVRVEQSEGDAASHSGTRVSIDLLPTFVGCPALDMIAGDVRAKVSQLPGVDRVEVNWIFDPAWTVDRITPAGRESLREHGVTVPECRWHDAPRRDHDQQPAITTLRTSAVPCPFCGSHATYLDSPFGPTRCRTIYYCESCRNSFEHLKRV